MAAIKVMIQVMPTTPIAPGIPPMNSWAIPAAPEMMTGIEMSAATPVAEPPPSLIPITSSPFFIRILVQSGSIMSSLGAVLWGAGADLAGAGVGAAGANGAGAGVGAAGAETACVDGDGDATD